MSLLLLLLLLSRSVASCEHTRPNTMSGHGAVTEPTDYKDYKTNVKDADDCAKTCGQQKWCRAYTYTAADCNQIKGCGKDNKVCYLRDYDGGEKVIVGRTFGVCRSHEHTDDNVINRTTHVQVLTLEKHEGLFEQHELKQWKWLEQAAASTSANCSS